MKFNKIKERLVKLKEENHRLKKIIKDLVMEKDEKEIIKKVGELKKEYG